MDGGQVALLKDGKRTASAWMSDVDGQRRVFATITETGKTPVDEKPLTGGTQVQPDVIGLSDGRALVAYQENAQIRIAVIEANGAAGEPTDACSATADQSYADLVQLPDGGVLVAFEQTERGKIRVVVAQVELANSDADSGK